MWFVCKKRPKCSCGDFFHHPVKDLPLYLAVDPLRFFLPLFLVHDIRKHAVPSVRFGSLSLYLLISQVSYHTFLYYKLPHSLFCNMSIFFFCGFCCYYEHRI